jgi:hypothetical protein
MRRPNSIGTEAEEEQAGNTFMRWAWRESFMREQARNDWPTHVQYAGDGKLVVLRDGADTVWHAPAAVPTASA